MLDIENLRKLAKDDNKVFIAQHAMQRFRERGIKYSDVINCIIVGEIIEQYPNDYPTPSCLILGINCLKTNYACCLRNRRRILMDNNCILSF